MKRNLRSRGTRFLLLFSIALVVFLSSGCRSFRRPELPAAQAQNADIVLATSLLKRKQTVELEGEFIDGVLNVRRIEIEEDDDEIEVEGLFGGFEADGRFSVSGVHIVPLPNAVYLDAGKKPIDPAAISKGAFVKVECNEARDGLELIKLTVRPRNREVVDGLQGAIERINTRRGELSVGGIKAIFGEGVLVVWDVDGVEPPDVDARGHRVRQELMSGLSRVRHIDEDNRRPEDQWRIGDWAVIGGEVQYELEWRRNHNLQNDRDRDRLLHEGSLTIEGSFDLGEKVFAFAQFNAKKRDATFDGPRDYEFANELHVNEAFILFDDLFVDGFSLQVGRQDFDNGREWVMDDEMTAVRMWFNLDRAVIEAAVGATLIQPSWERDDVVNYLLGIHAEPFEDSELFVYALHRSGGRVIDLDRTHLGFSLEGKIGAFEYWGDYSWAFGTENDMEIDGWGVDAAVMYVFEDLPMEPSVYAGWAYGSGDANPSGGTDGNFRQTGLNDNNDKFNGVTSFRYLGELFRPNLFNIQVWTIGAGLRPLERTSVDLIFHKYIQNEAAPFIGKSRIRLTPQGMKKDMGWEMDLVFGLEYFSPVETEIVLSYFHPGEAFGTTPDDAWFLTFKIEYNF